MLNIFKKRNIPGEWHKVSELEVGMFIAVPKDGILDMHQNGQIGNADIGSTQRQSMDVDDVLWDEIESIEYVGTEQVWDIEVEGTHNFVGNNIFAHNTYLQGNLGIGTSAPAYALDVTGSTRTSSQFISTVATGTSPLAVTSTTLNTNLNADLLDGLHSSSFQTILTNPVTGTGTTNYIPKFSGTSSLTTSQIFDNGTNVGIGTTVPIDKLQVNGGIRVTGPNAGNLANSAMLSQEPSGSYLFSWGPDASTRGNFKFYIAGSGGGTPLTPMVIDNAGSVGIGTTAPSQMLSVGASNQFTVTSAGALTSVGVNSGSGLIQGTGGLTITGTVSLPNNSITDAMVSDTLTASNLVAASSVVSNAEVDDNLTITGGSIDGTTTIAKSPVITLGTDLSGSVTLANLASGTLNATIAADSVALTTDTTGNYVGTITGSGTITSSGATTGEGIAHTLSVTADSIGDTQLAFNTGQHLTTTSSPTFATVSASLSGTATSAYYQLSQDRSRGTMPTPNSRAQQTQFDFANASIFGGTVGNYGGVMTWAPYDGGTASTGDASYQIGVVSTAVNGGGYARMLIRKGIDATWNSWQEILTSSNFAGTANQITSTLTSGALVLSIPSDFRAPGTVTAATSFLAPTFDTSTGVAMNIGTATQTALTLGRVGAATTINGSGLTVGPTSWTATPTISGLITATSGLTSNGTLTANGIVNLGDGGDAIAVNSNTWDISSAGAVSGVTTIGMNGQLTSTLATGTAPFAVTSTTLNTNLNADMLDGIDSSRIVYGDNATGSIAISENNANDALKTGVYTVTYVNGTKTPLTSGIGNMFRAAYTGVGNLAGFELFTKDSTTSDLYLRASTGGGFGSWRTLVDSSNIGTYGVSSFSAGSTGLTPSTATTGVVTLGGTLVVGNGGTGATTGTTINGTAITYGTTNTITAAAGTLTGTTLASGVVTSSLTTVGALASGSIASGFGTIATANTITGTTINGTTGINTGAGAGTNRIDVSGNLLNIGTITSGLINSQTISSAANFTGSVTVATGLTVDTNLIVGDATNHRVYIGAATEATSSSKLYVTGTTAANGSSSAIAGILSGYTFNPSAGGVQVGNRFVVTNAPTSMANTGVGEIIRMVDNTTLSNLVRGLDVTSNGGSNTAGTNTGIRGTGATFGVQGSTSALAGAAAVPAALYGESTGTTQGDVLRLYSQTMTSATSFGTFYHDTSTFTGTGLLMKFATGSGSFTGNFIDLQKNNVSMFKVTNAGVTSLGLSGTTSTTAVCSSLANGTAPTAGVAYELRDCSGSPAADYAEMYPVSSDIEYGDIVATGTDMISTYDVGTDGGVDWNKVKGNVTKLVKSTDGYQQNVIGIVSDNKNDFSSTGYNIKDTDNPMPVALNGRVPVKISQSSSPIKAGDYITTSQMDPGMATRALRSGFVIGKALEDWSPNSDQKMVMVFVEQGYYESDGAHEFVGESTFSGLTFFNASVEFAKSVKFDDVAEFVVPPLFNSDTAGFAMVKAGSDKVEIVFDKAYIATPIVNTTVSFEKVKNADGTTVAFDTKAFFDNDIKSVVIDKDEKGFSIVINKVAPQDILFSWIALSVKNPKIFESVISGLVIDPTTTPTNLAQQNVSPTGSVATDTSTSQTTTSTDGSVATDTSASQTTTSTDGSVATDTSTQTTTSTDGSVATSPTTQTASAAGSGSGILDTIINALTGGSDTSSTTSTEPAVSTPVVDTTAAVNTSIPAPVAADTSTTTTDQAI